MKRNVYLVQAGCLYGNNYYLPYAVGMLAAFAFSDPTVNDSYTLKKIFYRLDDADEIISTLDCPCVVGFSNAIWNYTYNLEFAEKLKAEYPDCLIIFGGHHVPPTDEYLKEYPFIDILIHRKGEEAFRDVLIHNSTDGDFSGVANITYRLKDGTAVQTPRKNIDLTDYPSPYLTGIFDDILKDDYKFSCVLETNRGCPYNCSYCDWGELNSQVRLFPLDKVFAQLEWMSRNKIEFVYCIDANFGMFERDVKIAEKLVELKETTGYPNRLQVSYAKNEFDRTFIISKMLAEHGIGKGATLSLQSLSEKALSNVGRRNIPVDKYVSQIRRYRDAGITTYTELILGLPGETKESFIHGLCEVLELGQHNSVTVYNFELLPNSELSSAENIKKFGIKTVCTTLDQYHCGIMDNVLSGYSNIVVGTDTLSTSDWVETSLFSAFVQCMHHFGLLQCIAMYCRKEFDITYYDFYTRLFNAARKSDGICENMLNTVEKILQGFVDGKGGLIYYNEVFGKITFPVEEAAFLMLLYESDSFYDEIIPIINGITAGRAIPQELKEYQKSVLLMPGKNNFRKIFKHNYTEYFNEILRNDYTPLTDEINCCTFHTPFEVNSWEEYAKEIVWYGRRNGRMMFSNKPNTIEVTKGENIEH